MFCLALNEAHDTFIYKYTIRESDNHAWRDILLGLVAGGKDFGFGERG